MFFFLKYDLIKCAISINEYDFSEAIQKVPETLSLRILNQTSSSVVTTGTSVKFPTGFNYTPTAISSSTDIITFLSFDNSAIYAVAANYFA
jgi:hypothetical protein